MRLTVLKGLMLIMTGMLSGGIFAPWIISNNVFPVWVNIILMTLLIFGGVCFVELLYRKFFQSIKSDLRDNTDDSSQRNTDKMV